MMINNLKKLGSNGFTLLELMIVVAIIGILAAVAYPSYRDSLLKSRRTDAISDLSSAAQAMERCAISKSSTYKIIGQHDCSPTAYNSSEGYYAISAVTTATTFILTATAQNVQSSDSACTSLTITNTGLQGSTGTATAATCWGQ